MVNVPNGLGSLKSKVDDLDGDKLKTVPVDLRTFSDVVDKDVVQRGKYNKLNSKLNRLQAKVLVASILIHINCIILINRIWGKKNWYR